MGFSAFYPAICPFSQTMNKQLRQVIGFFLSIPGSVFTAVGFFSLLALFAGVETQFRFVLGKTSAILCLGLGLAMVMAGILVRKSNK